MTTAAQLTELAKPVTRTVYFAEFQFISGTQRVSSMNAPITWGTFLWVGLGAIGAIDVIDESATIDASPLNFTLNVANISQLALAIGDVEDYRGRPVRVYCCPMDVNFQIILDDSGNVPLFWRGIMDTVSVGMQAEQGQITLKCETSAYALKRAPSLRINAAQQKKKFPNDTGLDFLTSLISTPQSWLSVKFQQK